MLLFACSPESDTANWSTCHPSFIICVTPEGMELRRTMKCLGRMSWIWSLPTIRFLMTAMSTMKKWRFSLRTVPGTLAEGAVTWELTKLGKSATAVPFLLNLPIKIYQIWVVQREHWKESHLQNVHNSPPCVWIPVVAFCSSGWLTGGLLLGSCWLWVSVVISWPNQVCTID